jgi:hypothetical protein
MEHTRNEEGATATFGGNYVFSNDTNNPGSAGYAYANALLGAFTQYTESTSRPGGDGTAKLFEWFAQDTWRTSRKLTVDYGLRFAYYTHWRQKGGQAAAFSVERFDPAKAPRLYRPALVGSTRVGVDPVTGQTVPAVLIGAFVPGSGEAANGMALDTGTGYPDGFREQPPVLIEPRVGFAYDLRGNGKTAIRGSFGIFCNTRNTGNTNWTASRNPPLQFNPTIFYGNLATLLQSSSNLFPNNVQGFAQEVKTPRLYSYTIGVQRDIGWNTVVDVAYVGTKGRHLLNVQNINTVPYGARFLPENQDPTRANTALADNFFRPYPGYGDITYFSNIGLSDYDALQLQANRRFAHDFQFGVAYTLSKVRDYASTDTTALPLYQNFDAWSYARASFDQTHVAVINYTWDLPDASRLWDNPVVRAVFDNWQLSGITAFASGAPSGVALTTADSFDFSGGGDGTGVTVNGDPTLSSGARSIAGSTRRCSRDRRETRFRKSRATSSACPASTSGM